MNVFVSAPSEHMDLVRAVTNRVTDDGHEVYPWFIKILNEDRMSDAQIVACFNEGLAAVRSCDVFILVVTSPSGPSTGCAMELAMAMWFGRDARLLELVEIDDACPWFNHPGRKWFCLNGDRGVIRFGPEKEALTALLCSLKSKKVGS